MINKVGLLNFKCFQDETVSFNSLTLLAGLNGMGKSTVFQALLLLRQNYELGLLKEDKGLLLNGELVQIGKGADVLYQYFESNNVGIGLFLDDEMHASWWWEAKVDSESLPLKEKIISSDEVYKAALFGMDFHYLNAERLGPRVYSEVSNYNVINKNNIGLRGEYAASFLSQFQSSKIPIENLRNPRTPSMGDTLLEQVNAWMSEIRLGTRVNVTSNLEMGLVGLNYQFVSDKDVSNKFRPTNVGFGLSFLLPIVVAILSSKPGALLLIENPEAHLHPQGQVRISELMAMAAANGIQIIVETHSDHILNGIRIAVKNGIIKPNKTALLFAGGKTEGDKFKHYIQSPKIDENGRIDTWPDGFFDEWDKSLANLISPSHPPQE